MTVNYELQNLIDHYGRAGTLRAFAEWLENEAAHCSDRGDEEFREAYEEAAEAVWTCVA